jgi:hypothetical protein
MDAKEMLEEAIELVDVDRATTHGSGYENHQNIAHLWNAYLFNKKTLAASDVANMMELLKIARRKLGVLNPDDYVDGAGYAAVAFECAKEQVAQSMANGAVAFTRAKEKATAAYMGKLLDDVIVETDEGKSGVLKKDGSLMPFDK